MLTVRVAEAELPARSVTVPVTDWLAPLAVRVVDTGQGTARPDSASEQVKLTVTLVLFQPLPLAAGLWDAVILGAVLSMLMPPTVAEAVLPALSVAVRVTD